MRRLPNKADAREAAASVPKMGVAASGGRFEGWTGTEGNWQNMSIGVSKSVILEGRKVSEDEAILQMLLKTLSFIQKDI